MLQWEGIMADDLKQYIYPESVMGIGNLAKLVANSTSTATSPDTEASSLASSSLASSSNQSTTTYNPLAPYFTIKGQFIDKLIQNKDVREFQMDDGQISFIYTFLDNSKLVFAGDEQVISEIMTRLEKAVHLR